MSDGALAFPRERDARDANARSERRLGAGVSFSRVDEGATASVIVDERRDEARCVQ
jgi:hypothetical protein